MPDAAEQEPALPPPNPELEMTPILSKAQGKVVVRLASSKWKPAQKGDAITPGTRLRTQNGGEAQLSYGDSIRVDVREDTEVRLERFDGEIAKFVVGAEGGLVIADVAPGNTRLVQIAAEGSDAVAATRDGKLHLMSDGRGQVQAAVTRGQATFTSAGKTVTLEANTQSAAAAGKAPTAPAAIPASLLLKIKWPDANTAKQRHLLSGTTSPGARVKIGDEVITADSKGRFRAIVQLREGNNQVEVQALDVVGRKSAQRSPVILVDTRAPDQAIKTHPDMWKKKQ